MSLDEKAEQALFDAIAAVANIPRPMLRARIWSAAGGMIVECMQWNNGTTEIKHESGVQKKTESGFESSAQVEKLSDNTSGESPD